MILSAAFVMAQAGPTEKSPEEHADRMTARMTESLNLTDDQVASVHQLNLELAQQLKVEEASRKAAMETYRKDLELVLTEEQMNQFKEHMAKRKKMRMHKKHERAPQMEEHQKN